MEGAKYNASLIVRIGDFGFFLVPGCHKSRRTIAISQVSLIGQLVLDEPENFLQGVLVVHDSGAFALVDSGVALLKSLERFFARKCASFHDSPSIHSPSSRAHNLN